MKRNKHSSRRKLATAFIGLMVAALVIFVLEITNTTHLFHKSPVVRAPIAPVTSLPTQTSTSSATDNSKTLTTTTPIDQGVPTDENGKVPSSVPTSPSDWSTSTSGVIVVKLPGANSTFQPGGTITGTAKVSQVEYRLIDSQVGVISQGPINVVNGNFTASINFKSYGTSGRLDVFTTDTTGKESNEVQIPVNF